ncbi:hypothetical protein BSKO_07786 [Bryopsis sp. KO-2023]|nr:hypothetical protein BSKO_07786 [Bryopsis sp. KO-2023]
MATAFALTYPWLRVRRITPKRRLPPLDDARRYCLGAGRWRSWYRGFGVRRGDVCRGRPSRTTHARTAPDDQAPGCRGMRNSGNSCYQNSILQCLNSVPEFVEYVRGNASWREEARVGPKLTRVFDDIWSSERGSVISPEEVQNEVVDVVDGLTRGAQEDAHEFLVGLLNALREEGSRNISSPQYRELDERSDHTIQAKEEWQYAQEWNNSPIDDIFGFQIHSTISCPSCGKTSHRFEYATEIQVDIPQSDTTTRLDDCFREYTKAEVLDGYSCSECKKSVKALRRSGVYRFPKALVVVLKRFTSEWDGFSLKVGKVPTPVEIDKDCVDMSMVSSKWGVAGEGVDSGGPGAYDLVAISNHFGSLNFGHYTALGRGVADQEFREFDDWCVRNVDQRGFQCDGAYILFFTRRDDNGI